jgi:hypothetical protein
MASKALPSQEVLCQILRYETDTGKLFWKERGLERFTEGKQRREHNAAIWNGRFAGKEAFITALPTGHRYAGIFGVKYLAHRIIWKMIHNEDAVGIDHIDGDPTNNRLSNLREAPQSVNGKNMKIRRNNTSGVMGVNPHRNGRWVASITLDYRKTHLGVFDSFDDAVAARKAAEITHDFHPNHGRAA